VTRGRRALLAVLQIIRGREIAARVRVSPATVSKWSTGLRRPSARARALLEQHVRIPASAWDEPAVHRSQRRTQL
jgi:transcriptional regulator with XRE-family HTH domain